MENIEKNNVLNFGGRCSNFEASFNFVNSILGAGIIGIPLAIQQCGLVMGILVFALVAFFIYQSVTMMIACGIQRGVYNLEELAEVTLGSTGYYIATVGMFIFACGGQTAYFVILGDTVPSVAHFFSDNNIFTNRTFCLLMFGTFIILPLCLSRDLDHLAWSSFLSIVLEVVLLVVIAAASFQEHSQNSQTGFQPADVNDVNLSLFAGVGTMSFALVCQHNSFLLFQSLSSPTMSNWKLVAGYSILFGFTISLLVGLVGFIAFYPDVRGDILNNFPVRSSLIGVARGILAATMLFTYPMELYVSRHCIMALVNRWRGRKPSVGQNNLANQQNINTNSDSHSHIGESNGVEMRSLPTLSAMHTLPSPLQNTNHKNIRISKGGMGKPGNFLRYNQIENVDRLNEVDDYDEEENKNTIDDSVTASSPNRRHQGNTFAALPTQREKEQDIPSKLSVWQQLFHSNNNQAMDGRVDDCQDQKVAVSPFHETEIVSSGVVFRTESDESDMEEITFDDTKGVEKSLDMNEKNMTNCSTPVSVNMDSRNSPQIVNIITPNNASSLSEHVFWTISIWLVTLSIALSARELGVVSALTGTIAASTLGYTLPALIFFRCHDLPLREFGRIIHQRFILRHSANNVNSTIMNELWPHVKLFCLPTLIFVFGIATFFIGVTTVLVSAGTSSR